LKNCYMICISIQHIEQFDELKMLKPAMLELRFDLINETPGEVIPIVSRDTIIIATCRPGKHDRDQRILLLKSCIDLGAQIIDLEIEADEDYQQELISYAKEKNCEVIISWHNFEKTPGKKDLESIIKDCFSKGADIAKIATLVNNEADNARLLSLYSMEGRKVVLGMGKKGKITRLAATHLGAEFTFASTGSGNETAPGQITIEEFSALNKIIEP